MKKKANTDKEQQSQKESLVSDLQVSILSAMAFATVPLSLPGTAGKEKVRVSGHYMDQKLKYQKTGSDQLTIFDMLKPDTLDQIPNEEISTTAIGIPLTVAQDKFMQCCLNLLYSKSNTKIDQKNIPAEPEQFYRGNLPDTERKHIQIDKMYPAIIVTPHELYTAYTQNSNYSGEDISRVKKIKEELTTKRWLMVYKRKRIVRAGKTVKQVTDRIEEYQPLIRVIKYSEGLTKEEDKQLDKNPSQPIKEKTKLIIVLHSIFTDQLETKYISIPTDISKQTELASGGAHKVTEAIISLRDFLMRSLSTKTYTVSLNKDTLPELLKLHKYIKGGRRKKIETRIAESIQAVINLGLVLEVKDTYGKNQQPQYQFTLNKDF